MIDRRHVRYWLYITQYTYRVLFRNSHMHDVRSSKYIMGGLRIKLIPGKTSMDRCAQNNFHYSYLVAHIERNSIVQYNSKHIFIHNDVIYIYIIIKLSPAKSFELDPLPTWLLKECIAELVPTITDIVNMSLRDSLMPKSLKTALIRPLLKKTGLDSDILKNYRPVSNLTFISKVIEKVVSGRLIEHLIKNSMFDPLQSAYRDKHSTETALIKVQNDILSALDAGSSAILLMLDLSAAFDTIDHDILLSRLCNVYGITGNALDWFRSYITGRIQRVVIENENAVSGDQELGFEVPQGSVLGPKIYCMYTKPVSDIIQRHGLSHHSYADDTQLYMTMDHSNNNWPDGLARIQLCVSEIREWMNQNMLKLNDDKTELIVFTSKYKQDLYNDLSITNGDTVVDCS